MDLWILAAKQEGLKEDSGPKETTMQPTLSWEFPNKSYLPKSFYISAFAGGRTNWKVKIETSAHISCFSP
jgi:hypothetical protein